MSSNPSGCGGFPPSQPHRGHVRLSLIHWADRTGSPTQLSHSLDCPVQSDGPWQRLWLHREGYSVVGGRGAVYSSEKPHHQKQAASCKHLEPSRAARDAEVRSPVRRSDPSRPPPQTHIIPKSGARAQDAPISGVWVWFGFHSGAHEFSSDHFSNHSSNELDKLVGNYPQTSSGSH